MNVRDLDGAGGASSAGAADPSNPKKRARKKTPKDVEIKARVTGAMRDTLEKLAEDRGESLSLIVREAIAEYLARKK